MEDPRLAVPALGWFSVISILLFGGLALGFCVQSGQCMSGGGNYASVCIGVFNASAPICDPGSLAIMGLIAVFGGLGTPLCVVLAEVVIMLLFVRKVHSDYRRDNRFRLYLVFIVAVVAIGIFWAIFWISIWINALFAGLYIGSLYFGLLVGGGYIIFSETATVKPAKSKIVA
jgi:Ca2+/Na+ antiporter